MIVCYWISGQGWSNLYMKVGMGGINIGKPFFKAVLIKKNPQI
jgi:hypothetical protein